MDNNIITNMTNQFLEAEQNVLDQVLTQFLGHEPGKVDQFLIKKTYSLKASTDYVLEFDDYFLGYVEFIISESGCVVNFTPMSKTDGLDYINKHVATKFVEIEVPEVKLDRMLDHWSEVDNINS